MRKTNTTVHTATRMARRLLPAAAGRFSSGLYRARTIPLHQKDSNFCADWNHREDRGHTSRCTMASNNKDSYCAKVQYTPMEAKYKLYYFDGKGTAKQLGRDP